MFTNFTCSSYLIIWHIKIQLNHWQWHNNQWKWKWNTQSEISLCHHSTSINWDKHWFLYMCSEEMEFNKINEWSEKLSAQQNVKHWTKSRGQSSSTRCERTGVTKTTTKDSLVWLTHQRRQQPQVSNCCPICFTSQFDDHQMPGGLNKGYTR